MECKVQEHGIVIVEFNGGAVRINPSHDGLRTACGVIRRALQDYDPEADGLLSILGEQLKHDLLDDAARTVEQLEERLGGLNPQVMYYKTLLRLIGRVDRICTCDPCGCSCSGGCPR